MADIFISYARADRPRVEPLVRALGTQDWTVWWDPTVRPGKKWDRVIEFELSQAKCVIVLWSKSSVESDWVRSEANEASRRGILVPALLDDVRIPLAFQLTQAARLVDWPGSVEDREFQELCASVSEMISRSGAPAEPGATRAAGVAISPEAIGGSAAIVESGDAVLTPGPADKEPPEQEDAPDRISTEQSGSNINGKAYAMTAMTPMKPSRTPFVRLILFLLRTIQPLTLDLTRLSLTHSARWVIVTRGSFPRLSPVQPVEDLSYDYLLFFNNFNGTRNQYVDALSTVLSNGLDVIWRWTEKYPGATPMTPFKRYIDRAQFDTNYYYNAYPKSSINDIKAANRVQDAVDDFERASGALSPAEFEKAYLDFVFRVQADLGSTGEAPIGT